ncbi:MAG: 2-keto-4-pentenoate hydratase [Gammaproteobacteria bacterium]
MDANERRARQLFRQHQAGQAFRPFSGDEAVAGIDDAYAIQDGLVHLLTEAGGETVAGYKIGLTSPRMQALLGIDSPIAGVVFASRVHASGVTVRRGDFGRLGIECEIAVRLARDLPPAAAPFDEAAVAAAVAAVCPAFELVDDRAADYAVTDIGSLVADNSWNAGVVLGAWCEAWPPLADVEGVVRRDGEVFDRGRGSDVLGHPFVPLAWLANHLARGRRGLRAGDVVATGSVVPTRVPTGPERITFEVDGLGSVSLDVE